MQPWQNRIIGLEYHKPGDIAEHPYQWRAHTETQVAAIKGILAEVGIAGALLAYHSPDNDGALTAIDGHLRKSLKSDVEWPVLVLDVDDAEALKLLATFDPIGAMAQVDLGALQKVLERVEMEDTALQAMLKGLAEDAGIDLGGEKPEDPGAQVDKAAELQEKWGTCLGQVWEIEEHRLVCGDCTDPGVVASVMRGEKADYLLTDPPYCSGGFQESGRSSGSVGTSAVHKRIVADTLSTRGYIALMKAMLATSGTLAAYIFTDWRMWVNLFDAVESSGFGVRQMIVWDKGTPGMGHGWRAQHELIMFALKGVIAFDKFGHAFGNVVQAQRTGNQLHTTEKPVELIERLMEVMASFNVVLDPFLGSGTTMVAAHKLNRRCFGIEISPAYCAVILERMTGMGLEARLLE